MAYAVRNGTLYTCDVSNTVIDHGTLLIKDGKIEALLARDQPIPEGYEVIDAEGKVVVPGFVNSHTHEGVYDASFGDMGVDANEMTNPSTPMVRVIDAINTEAPNFVEGVKGGVTTINTGPGSGNVIGGQFALLKTWAKSKAVENYIIRAPSAMKAALGENPKNVYGSDKKLPSTRMGIAAVFRKSFVDAQ
ncbi:MAG: amidohydrolase family protein, partial [Promethearchaeota archaeon]